LFDVMRGGWRGLRGRAPLFLNLENALRRHRQEVCRAIRRQRRLTGPGRRLRQRDAARKPPAVGLIRERGQFSIMRSESDSHGAGSVSVSVKTKLGIFDQWEIATVSVAGCNCHCCGSVGVAASSGVAGTTWTMR